MEWTTNIDRTLRSNNGRNGNEHISLLPMLLHSTDGIYDQEEFDYAKALSLSEMEVVKQRIIEKHKMEAITAQIEEDEQLANAMQLSLVMESSLTNGSAHASSSRPFSAAMSKILCAGCNTEISIHEHVFCWNGIVWHIECLLCLTCKQLIKDDEIPYINGVVKFSEHPFWAQKYCPSHEDDGTSSCVSCERLQPKGINYILLKDGRSLCPECFSFKIMDTNECQPLFHEIQEFFASLHMKLNQTIPLGLVEREALNNAMEGEKNGHYHLSETRGLCLSEEQTIPIIHMRKHIGRHSILDILTQPRRLVRNCEVTAILILYGLPRLLTGSILAHEMMHAWLRLQGYPNLKPEIEEGICQVLAHIWLKSKINMGSDASMAATSSSSSLQPPCSNKQGKLSEIEKKLGECFIRQIELDASPAYGDGFRVGEQAVSKYGLKETLDHIKLTQTFPV
ncbi:protein DA1-related 1-like isoform X2 [Benincasa hispida]|uniref:protein DA1-related 1-like isoform X2 n=1 Tax=Benincasa hispida TaxID=102211 RepID=UPI0019004A5F|nr:protein DA1-related 1-like isoform X2 [Benincasa hispida]